MKIVIFAIAYLNLFLVSTIAQSKVEWNIDKPSRETPGELYGDIFGRKFVFGSGVWSKKNGLVISSKDMIAGWPKGKITIFLARDDRTTEWIIVPDTEDHEVPSIHMNFGKEGLDFPGTMVFTGEYSMYLKIVEISGKKAKVMMHLSLPDYKKSYLAGTFEVELKD